MTQALLPGNQYPHLELPRTQRQQPRWKGRPPSRPPLYHATHGMSLRAAAEQVVSEVQRRPRPEGIDPANILRVRLTSPVEEDTLRRAGFTVLVGQLS